MGWSADALLVFVDALLTARQQAEDYARARLEGGGWRG